MNNGNDMPGGTASDATMNESRADGTAPATGQSSNQDVLSNPPLNLDQ